MLTKKMQGIIDALNDDRQALIAAVSGLTEAQFAYQPAAGQWSIADVLHHLVLVEEANQKLFGMMLKKAAESGAPADPSPDESVTDAISPYSQALLDREQKVTAPERVQPVSAITGEAALTRLQAVRENTVAAAEKLGQYDLSLMKWPHPLFGELNLYQWFLFVGLHERRHADQISEIRSGSGFPQ